MIPVAQFPTMEPQPWNMEDAENTAQINPGIFQLYCSEFNLALNSTEIVSFAVMSTTVFR